MENKNEDFKGLKQDEQDKVSGEQFGENNNNASNKENFKRKLEDMKANPTRLVFKDTQITDELGSKIAHTIDESKELEVVEFDNVTLSVKGWKKICRSIFDNEESTVNSFHLKNTDMRKHENAVEILNTLAEFITNQVAHVNDFVFTNNNLSDQMAKVLAVYCTGSDYQGEKSIDLTNSNITPKACKEILMGVANAKCKVQRLIIGPNWDKLDNACKEIDDKLIEYDKEFFSEKVESERSEGKYQNVSDVEESERSEEEYQNVSDVEESERSEEEYQNVSDVEESNKKSKTNDTSNFSVPSLKVEDPSTHSEEDKEKTLEKLGH